MTTRLTTVVPLLGAVAFSAAGQLLLKAGARQLEGLSRLEYLVAAARHPQVLSGLAAWTASTLCWLLVLRVAPLSRTYGLTSLSYVFVFTASVFLFGEEVRRVHVIGTAMIVVGIVCLLSGD